jgi:hypothetical protein
VFYLNRVIISQYKNDKKLDSFRVILNMFVVQNLIQEYWWGHLVGYPYIASLWLRFPICEVLAPIRVLRHSLALFCLLPGYKLRISVNKRVKGSLCYLRAHFRV